MPPEKLSQLQRTRKETSRLSSDLRYTPNDVASEVFQYINMRERLVSMLLEVDAERRAIALKELFAFVVETNEARIPLLHQRQERNRRRVFAENFCHQYGVPVEQLISLVLNPLCNKKRGDQFSVSRLLTNDLLAACADSVTIEDGAKAYLRVLSTREREQLFSQVQLDAYDHFESATPNPLGENLVLRLEDGSYLSFIQAKKFALELLGGRTQLNSLSDDRLIALALLLKAYGYLEASHQAAQFLVPAIAQAVQPRHPAFLHLIKERANQYVALDSPKLQNLKNTYELYAVYALSVHELVENGYNSALFEQQQRRNAFQQHRVTSTSISSGGGRGPSTPEMLGRVTPTMSVEQRVLNDHYNREDSTGAQLDPDMRAALRTAESIRLRRKQDQAHSLQLMHVQAARRKFTRKSEELRNEYGITLPTITNLHARQLLSALQILSSHPQSDSIISDLYSFFSNNGLFDQAASSGHVSQVELVTIACMKLMENADLTNSGHRDFVTMFQNQVLPILRAYHDSNGAERQSAIEQIDHDNFGAAESRFKSLRKYLQCQSDGLTDINSSEAQQQRQKVVKLLKKHRAIFEKAIQLIGKTEGKNTILRRDGLSKALYQLFTLVLAGGVGFMSSESTGVNEVLLKLFVDNFKRIQESDHESMAVVSFFISGLILFLEVGGLIFLFSQVYQSKVFSLLSQKLDSVSIYLEVHYQKLLTTKDEVVKRVLYEQVRFFLLVALSASVGYYHTQAADGLNLLWDTYWSKEIEIAPQADNSQIDFMNIPEAPAVGEPTFYTYGIKNHPGTFWIDQTCGLVDGGAIVCGGVRDNVSSVVEYEQVQSLTYHSSENVKYGSDLERRNLVQKLENEGYLIRFNEDIHDPFFGRPSGLFEPRWVLSHQDDPEYVIAERNGSGSLIYDTLRPLGATLDNKHPVAVVYRAIETPAEQLSEREYTAQKFPLGLVVGMYSGLGNQNPSVSAISRDLAQTWWKSGLDGREEPFSNRFFSPISPEAVIEGDHRLTNHELRAGLSVLLSGVMPIEQLRSFNLLAAMSPRIFKTEGSFEDVDDVIIQEEIVAMSRDWSLLIVPSSDGDDMATMLILSPDSHVDKLNTLLGISEGEYPFFFLTLKSSPSLDSFDAPVGLTAVSTADLSTVVYAQNFDSYDEPVSSNTRSSYASDAPLAADGIQTPLPQEIADRFIQNNLPKSVRQAFNEIVADRVSFSNIAMATRFYQSMRDAGYEYGFEPFVPNVAGTDVDAFIEQLSVDESGKLRHPQQICNQFALDLYMLMKMVDPSIPVLLARGYSQQTDTQYGGNASASHMVLLVADETTGYWQVFDATLPDKNGDTAFYEYLPPETVDTLSLLDRAVPLGLLLGASAGLLYTVSRTVEAGWRLTRKKKPPPIRNVDTLEKNKVLSALERVFEHLTPQELLATYYALIAAFGPEGRVVEVEPNSTELHGDKIKTKQTGKVRSVFTGKLRSFDRRPDMGGAITWANYDRQILQIGDYISDQANGVTPLSHAAGTVGEVAGLVEWMREKGMALPMRRMFISSFFDRYFRRALTSPKVDVLQTEQQVLGRCLFNVREIARSVESRAPNVANALMQVHVLATSRKNNV